MNNFFGCKTHKYKKDKSCIIKPIGGSYILKNAIMFARLGFNDFKAKYAGSFLGMIWAVAEPIVMVFVYWFVYTIALGFDDSGRCPYYLWLAVGLAAWNFVSDGIRGMTSGLRDYSYLVTKTGFENTGILRMRVFSAFVSHLIFLCLVMFVASIENMFNMSWLFLPLYTVLGYIFVYSYGGVLAVLCGKYKDVQNIVNVVLNVLFWMTPVFWDMTNITNGLLVWVIKLNPMAIIIQGYRDAFINNLFVTGDFLRLFIADVLGIVLLKSITKKYLPNIADNM